MLNDNVKKILEDFKKKAIEFDLKRKRPETTVDFHKSSKIKRQLLNNSNSFIERYRNNKNPVFTYTNHRS